MNIQYIQTPLKKQHYLQMSILDINQNRKIRHEITQFQNFWNFIKTRINPYCDRAESNFTMSHNVTKSVTF